MSDNSRKSCENVFENIKNMARERGGIVIMDGRLDHGEWKNIMKAASRYDTVSIKRQDAVFAATRVLRNHPAISMKSFMKRVSKRCPEPIQPEEVMMAYGTAVILKRYT